MILHELGACFDKLSMRKLVGCNIYLRRRLVTCQNSFPANLHLPHAELVEARIMNLPIQRS
ncbi:hypothetical protein QFZ34_002138 [Phyllobacterium ifriqiyense]|uniref:Uncharacterized protein n=1 Tax=Phyllobacterium ifriqiyense TaxID=314238 RepID=A0ABU0S8H5_9HYPH|nr:hypothetical protein [Phyllobacterium ifriqiyense]